MRAAFVSLSQKSACGDAAARQESAAELRVLGDEPVPVEARSSGFSAPSFHDQVLRNQSVGSTSIVAVSGPALRMLRRSRMSSGPALA